MSKIVRIDTLHSGDRKKCSANGDGVRIVVWFCGCDIRCEGCHNSEFWDFDNPDMEDFNDAHLDLIKHEMDTYPNFYSGLSILGGEPFARQNIDGVLKLCEWFRENYPNKNIWIWSGRTLEQLKTRSEKFDEYEDKIDKVLKSCDVLVDGPYIHDRRNISLKFRGSDNQRIIILENGRGDLLK